MSSELSHQEVSDIIRTSAGSNRIVFTNGCFDILHPGHLDVIKKCRELAGPKGTVVVGINSDASVSKLKGPNRPIMKEDARAEIIANIDGVDFAVLFSEDTPQMLLESLRPEIVVKGGDYKVEDVVGHDMAIVVIVPTRPGYSTSEILARMNS